MKNTNNTDLLTEKDNLISWFLFLKPSIKFLTRTKNTVELNKIIEWFLIKVEKTHNDKELLNLSVKISNSDISDKIKTKLLLNINIIMYKLHNDEVIKAELKEVSDAVTWVL